MKELNINEILENTNDFSQTKKVGYVAIVGRPNVGKSTFINTLLGEKVSITTHVPQTTRRKVLGIFNDKDSQIIFFDTPGIHKSERKFNEKINDVAIGSFKDSELILYFIDGSRNTGEEEEYIEEILEKVNKPVLKIYTKSDLPMKIHLTQSPLLTPPQPSPKERGQNKEGAEQKGELFQISSVEKKGFDELLEKIKTFLQEGPLLFPEDYYTKQDIYFRISEIIREKTFLNTKEELPHSTYIGVEELEDEDEILRIVAYIYVESDSQKYIMVGKGGALVGKIGKEARLELEDIFEKKVFLALRVKVKKNWRKDDGLVKRILH